jgi:plasmid stabilization system protein ParE
MAKPLRMLDEAIDEAHEAWTWYQQRSDRAASRFEHAFDRAIQEIRDDPERWPEYRFGTRFWRLRKFPYIVVYRVTEDEVQVIAVAHGHRKEAYWRRRIS